MFYLNWHQRMKHSLNGCLELRRKQSLFLLSTLRYSRQYLQSHSSSLNRTKAEPLRPDLLNKVNTKMYHNVIDKRDLMWLVSEIWLTLFGKPCLRSMFDLNRTNTCDNKRVVREKNLKILYTFLVSMLLF